MIDERIEKKRRWKRMHFILGKIYIIWQFDTIFDFKTYSQINLIFVRIGLIGSIKIWHTNKLYLSI
jgi:hypothetical protein